MPDTIFALASGAPPAAIAVIRLSGPRSVEAVSQLCGNLPEPGRLRLRRLTQKTGEVLDEAMVIWSRGPSTVTGEDYAEIHCHGGRAVVRAIEEALSGELGLRRAEPGEFTRRGFANGKMDLAQAEALGDLLQAETELQRRFAMGGVGGSLSRMVERWRGEVLFLSAMIEAVLDFSDEDDVADLPEEFHSRLDRLKTELLDALDAPRAEMLRDGFRIVIAGPPNSGKSSLFNRLLDDEAAIVSPVPGTTRDVLERRLSLAGIPVTLIDTAGLNEGTSDPIEQAGIVRARGAVDLADLVVWTGSDDACPDGAVQLVARCDLESSLGEGLRVSAKTGEGIGALLDKLSSGARDALGSSHFALNGRQNEIVEGALRALEGADNRDRLLIAESLKVAREAFDTLVGRSGIEDVLDVVFGRFCIGK